MEEGCEAQRGSGHEHMYDLMRLGSPLGEISLATRGACLQKVI